MKVVRGGSGSRNSVKGKVSQEPVGENISFARGPMKFQIFLSKIIPTGKIADRVGRAYG